ncbi:organic anion transporter 3-like [Petaurus breviceps papuanus]|uniref:organic anion transporter 3-like n=1 Tax=Petaurus breviceps papuanus TaxID=3040969 RepID=UPI0036DBC42B
MDMLEAGPLTHLPGTQVWVPPEAGWDPQLEPPLRGGGARRGAGLAVAWAGERRGSAPGGSPQLGKPEAGGTPVGAGACPTARTPPLPGLGPGPGPGLGLSPGSGISCFGTSGLDLAPPKLPRGQFQGGRLVGWGSMGRGLGEEGGLGGLLEQTGGWGRFQTVLLAIVSGSFAFATTHSFLQNFTASVPDHYCRSSRDLWPVDAQGQREKCLRFKGNATNETESCVEGWMYNVTSIQSTIITEWDLVCNLKSLQGVAQSVYMAGVFLGAIVFGGLADRLGRRTIFSWCLLQVASLSTGAALAPSFSIYCVCRCLCGSGMSGLVLNGIGLVLEWTTPSRRAAVSGFLSFVLSLGQLNLAILAFGLRRWRYLQLAAGAPFALCFLCSWWLPESIRWLMVRRHFSGALQALRLVSCINRVPAARVQLSLEMLESDYSQEEVGGTPGSSFLDLFRSREMLAILACIMGLWFSASFSFFSLALDLQRFPGEDPYLVQIVLGVIDLPFRLLVPKLANRLGRKVILSSCMVFGAGLLLGAIPVPQELGHLRMALSVLSKGFMSASLSCNILIASEVFPTSLRMTGMGITNMVGHLGGMVASLVLLAGPTLPLLPPILFGTTVLAASFLVVFLPETRGLPLPDTLEQAQSQVRRCWSRLLRKSRQGALPLQTKL